VSLWPPVVTSQARPLRPGRSAGACGLAHASPAARESLARQRDRLGAGADQAPDFLSTTRHTAARGGTG